MSKIRNFSRELWVGLLGIAALLIIYFLINFFKGVNVFDTTDKYHIEFANIGEITNSAPVFINGCKVGNVSAINYNFNNDRNVYVTVSLYKGLRLPQGSYAEIHNKLMGGSTISLVLGNSQEAIKPGSKLRGILDAGALGEVGNMMPQIEAMLPKMDSILTSVNSILANPAINNTLNNIETLTAQLNTTTERLNRIVEKDIPAATEKLIALEDDLLKVSSQLSEVDYLKLVNTLQESLDNIEQITTALNDGKGTIGMLLKDSTLYDRLNKTSEAATLLLEDLKQNPKRYVHFSVFGKKAK